jgi:hypothetical protein
MSFPDLAPYETRPLASQSDPHRRPGYTTYKLWLPDTDPHTADPRGLLLVDAIRVDGRSVTASHGDNSWYYETDIDCLSRLSDAGAAPLLDALGIQLTTTSEKATYDEREKRRYALTFPSTERMVQLGNIALGNSVPPGPHFASTSPGHYSHELFTQSIAQGAFLFSRLAPTPESPTTDASSVAMHDVMVHAVPALAVAKSRVFPRMQARAQKICAGETPNDTSERLMRHADFAVTATCMEGLLWDDADSRYFIQDLIGELPTGASLEDYFAELVSYVKAPHAAGLLAINSTV